MSLADVIHRQVINLPPPRQAAVLDYVLSLRARPSEEESSEVLDVRRRRLAKALERLRRLGTFSDIAGPVAWQRAQRQDRLLPGREI